ncbi:MAG TPA: D-alanyl-D-alanine carboxypeptidase/D-alanyl-D-alanine-endopeptidase [Bacteroidota bacterium]|nr:D-alanyl-D-alanine carboxypeptidase/D-alanyl-D-alanine-endopeptidase [Bacteroidota bacterium]
MKKTSAPFLILLLLISGCATVEKLTKGPSAEERFRERVDAILADSIFAATRCGIEIVSLEDGEVLYERDARSLLRPASNMKLLTSAAALLTLPKSYLFRTILSADTAASGDTLLGNVYVKGFGDPDFTSNDLASLIAKLRAKRITEVRGNLVGDARFFDDDNWGEGWMWDDEPSGFAAYNSALSINRNCVEVTVSPGFKAGDTVRVSIEPPTTYVSLVDSAITTADTSALPLEISRKFKERLNTVVVKGRMVLNAKPEKELLSVLSPEMYFLSLAREEMKEEGIALEGRLLLDTMPAGAVEVAESSRSLDSVVVYLNKASDNLSAENLLKVVGAQTYGVPGSTAHGIAATRLTLESIGIDSSLYLMVDGSGVSHYNLVTADAFVRLLRGMYRRSDLFGLYFNSLPNAGVDGLLINRMRGTAAQGNLHAKTGTIRGASCLSGYVRSADGELLAFSIMMQNYIGSGEAYRRAQDEIGVLMAGLHRK